MVLGRDPKECHIIVPDTWVSRRHCKVAVDPLGNVEVCDASSRNGILVNGERVQRSRLVLGDLLQICDHRFVLTRAGAR
jgi:pSer/pThr/pTyr-binding forkhead associated (FHA) protein